MSFSSPFLSSSPNRLYRAGHFLNNDSRKCSLVGLSVAEKTAALTSIKSFVPVLPSVDHIAAAVEDPSLTLSSEERLFVSKFNDIYYSSFNYNDVRENQLINAVILPLFEEAFLLRLVREEGDLFYDKSQLFTQHWPIGEDEGLKKKADFGLKTLVGDHMVLIAEVKTMNNRKAEDMFKLANCMKASVDRSKNMGYPDAAVCGLFVKGQYFKVLCTIDCEDKISVMLSFKYATRAFWSVYEFNEELAYVLFFGEEEEERIEGQLVWEKMARRNPLVSDEEEGERWVFRGVDLSSGMTKLFDLAKAKIEGVEGVPSRLGDTMYFVVEDVQSFSLFEKLALSSMIFFTETKEGHFLNNNSRKRSLFDLSIDEKTAAMNYIKSLVPVLTPVDHVSAALEDPSIMLSREERRFVSKFNDIYYSSFNYNNVRENQLINAVILPLFEEAFLLRLVREEGDLFYDKLQLFTQHWPIGEDGGLKKKADFGLKTLTGDHMVLIAEVKTMDNQNAEDLEKLANCMKASVDRSQDMVFKNAAVCGLLIKGPYFKILYMDHMYKGGYRLLDVFSFAAPANRNDVENIKGFYHGTMVLNHVLRKVIATYKSIPTTPIVPMATIYIEVTKDLINSFK